MGKDRLTAEERAAIAGYDGPVTRVPARRKRQGRPVGGSEGGGPRKVELPVSGPDIASEPPLTYRVPAEMDVWEALQWAFGTERAQMDADEMGASSGGQRRGMSPEAVLEQRFMLGNVTIDTSPGRSSPADEADVIASVVRATLRWHDAVWIADLARAGRVPDAMVGEVPRLGPVEWHGNRHGWTGKAADSSEIGVEQDPSKPMRPTGWAAVTRRNRKGIVVRDAVRYTPCTWTPTASQIGAARRRYLDWWGHLLSIQVALQSAGLQRIDIGAGMPPMTPWRG